MGDRRRLLAEAAERIGGACGLVAARSAVYETEAWGRREQAAFLNQALRLHTSLSAPDLLRCLLAIEESMGRIRHEKYGPRTIDIDILLYNDDVMDEAGLTVPHPQLPNRRFALQCLADIAADEIHPVLLKTVRQLLKACTDELKVKKLGDF